MRRSGAWSRLFAVVRFTGRSGKRGGVTVVGVLVLATGAVMLVTPGPRLLVLVAGLALLATEYAWAGRPARAPAETGRAGRSEE